MKVAVEKITVPTMERILKAWVDVGGLDPEMEAKKIADAIKRVVETGDQDERFQLDDGYRCGGAKLYFRVRGEEVDIGMNAYLTSHNPAREQEADTVCSLFQEKLREIFA